MAGQETKSGLDVEAAFVCWYNNGQRRSYRQVADLFAVSGKTVGRVAWDHDWEHRAEQLDREAQALVDEQLIALRARSMRRLAEVATAELARFAHRPPSVMRDESGTLVGNPYLSKNREFSVADLLRTVKLLEATGLMNAGPDQDGDEDLRPGLQEMREMVVGLYVREEEETEAAPAMTTSKQSYERSGTTGSATTSTASGSAAARRRPGRTTCSTTSSSGCQAPVVGPVFRWRREPFTALASPLVAAARAGSDVRRHATRGEHDPGPRSWRIPCGVVAPLQAPYVAFPE